MQKILVFVLLFIMIGCGSRKISEDSSEKFVIENLAEVASEEKLSEVYPEARITQGTDLFQIGTEKRPYTIIFPNTPNEALIVWKDDSRTQLLGIIISKKGEWRTKSGIEIGTPYEQLVEINNAPVSFYGFGWDYGGAVVWEGGKLEDSPVRVFLAPKNKVPNEYYKDQIIEASKEEIEEMQLSVQSIFFQKE